MADLRKIKLTDYMDEVVTICDRCKGSGITSWDELENYHHRTYNTSYDICSVCEGSGRVIIQTIRIKGCIPYKQRDLPK